MSEIPLKTIRVKGKNLKSYEKTKTGWKLSPKEFPKLLAVVKLYKSARKFKELVDNDLVFLKGGWLKGEKGERIKVLPNGEVLDKAYSLFAPHLKIHDQKSHDHWDVIYQNKGGTWSYLYTLKKKKLHQINKYRKVLEFEKKYNSLVRKVRKDLEDQSNEYALPMYTLLKTCIRVGKKMYHGHRGLMTLTRKNMIIEKQKITFDFMGKDGVPVKIAHRFPVSYVKRLNTVRGKFIFSNLDKAFVYYCGHEFYPHIVRSHYATMKVKKFLGRNRKFSEADVKKLFMSIAHELGHKKFDKKKGEWQKHYAVTVNSYIQPELVRVLKRKM